MVNDELGGDSIENAGTIWSTKNYDLFRFLKENREISHKLNKKLLQSFRHKNIFGASTILVKLHDDGFYYIYEGQHRFVTSRELGHPIYFIVNQDLTSEDISLMNTNSDVWVLKDFLRKYLAQNVNGKYESYSRLQRVLDKYSNETEDDSVRAITFTDILSILTGWGNNVTNKFKNGTLSITEDDYDRAVKVCDMLQLFLDKDVLPENINVRKYIRAIIGFVDRTTDWTPTDTNSLLIKVGRYRNMIDHKNYGKEDMYKELLVDVYNKGQQKRFVEKRTLRGGKVNQYYISVY
jgi:hypothetical protein